MSPAGPGPAPAGGFDVLMVSEGPLWPADRGFRVHGSELARGMARRGARVAVSCVDVGDAPPPTDLAAVLHPWPTPGADDRDACRRAWGGPLERVRRWAASGRPAADRWAGLAALVDRMRPRMVVAVDRGGAMLLQGIADRADVLKVWHAADEGAYLLLSCLGRSPRRRWPGLVRAAAEQVAIERAFGGGLDAVIGVHPRDTRLLRLATGAAGVTVRNGVDLDRFCPDPDAAVDPCTLIFWGGLDFPPNVDAAVWLARRLMPALRRGVPDARLRLVGYRPSDAVLALRSCPGVDVLGPVDDLRGVARSSAAVALPMRCGGGIKNKLLEAAAMGLPIVASSRAVDGLAWDRGAPPFAVADGVAATCRAVTRLWSDTAEDARLRVEARGWVEAHHAWDAAAAAVLALLPGGVAATASRGGAAAANLDRRAA